VNSPPRMLIVGTPPALPSGWAEASQVVPVDDWALLAEMLRSGNYAGVIVDSLTAQNQMAQCSRNSIILGHIDKGIALLDLEGRVLWVNPVLGRFCQTDPVGRTLFEAFGSPTISAEQADPLEQARQGQPVSIRMFCPAMPNEPHIDVRIRPVLNSAGKVIQLVALTQNVSAEVEQQRKLDTLHQAGRELSGLDPIILAEMNLSARVELLKQNLRRCIHDLLKYDIIELRLLDRQTGELKPLLEEGMTPEAAGRVLYASPTGNGVTGYVAATGRSYLCPDTAKDPLYLQGATGARSSMTVPLKFNDEVVGTLNVESPRVNGFGPDDLQFTELFSKEIATALHTLELLTAQQSCTAAQSIEAVNREIALPLDQVLSSAATILSRLSDKDSETVAELHTIIASVRTVKESIRRVGQEMAAVEKDSVSLPLAGKQVLVIDADERTRRQAHLLLSRLGAEVETVATAREGLALLADTAYHAVFLDSKPSDMGGYEAYCRIRAARPEAQLALTAGFAYDAAHSIVKARQDGLQYVLFKPFQQEQVTNAVLGRAPAAVAKTASNISNGKL